MLEWICGVLHWDAFQRSNALTPHFLGMLIADSLQWHSYPGNCLWLQGITLLKVTLPSRGASYSCSEGVDVPKR